MRRALALFAFYLLPFTPSKAQLPSTPEGVRQPRILILLDGSSSMLSPWGKDLQRFGAAAKVVSALMDSIYAINNSVEFGLRVYGHTSPAQENNCTDTRREVMFSKNNATQMALRLAALHPLGVSPIAYSLREAATYDLEDAVHNAYSIILITDGGESCGGNICDVMRQLIQQKIYFKPYIIGLADYQPQNEQYVCLGTYLQATKESEIPSAIKKIADDYRPMLSAPIMVAAKPVVPPVKDTAVRVIIVPAPVRIPETTAVAGLGIVSRVPRFEAFYYTPLPRTAGFPVLPRVRVETEPDRIAVVALPAVKPTATNTAVTKPVIKPPLIRPLVVVAPLRRDTARTTTVVAKPPVVKLPKDTAKKVVAIKPPAVKPRTPPVRPPVKDNDKPKETVAVTTVEDSKETTAAIYFTDGHGKFYHTSPSMQLLDAKTGKLVKQFYRTVGPSGEPDPQQFPAGTYNLMITGRANLITRNVVIQPSKNNKILIPVSNGSIVFVYDGNRARPVKEFEVTVKIRFEEGASVRQNCAQELPYPPGNYYVEANTLPIKRWNTDVDFGSATELTIPEPGFLQITNRDPVGRVTLYNPYGDKYLPFHNLIATGNDAEQKVQLLPGAYEAHWVKKSQEMVTKFLVKPNEVIEVDLH